jgi:flavin reductase (DIM6/NTAB) family NADH-FMN oxidoreductase RutF
VLIDVEREKASRLINCGQLILVSCADEHRMTITTCAWHMPISRAPAIVGIALAKKHYSSELILKSKEFIINVPQWELLNKVVFCGKVSGRNCEKFKEVSFTPTTARSLRHCKAVGECMGFIECQLQDAQAIGDHYLFSGIVTCAYADDSYFHGDMWDLSRCQLIMHCGGNVFFRSQATEEYKHE